MTKTRLNTDMRGALVNHAKGLITCPDEDALVVSTKKALTDVTDALAAEHFPDRDMRVLRKYQKSQTREALAIKSDEGRHSCTHVPMSRAWDLRGAGAGGRGVSLFHFFPERRPDDPRVLDRFTIPRFDGTAPLREPAGTEEACSAHATGVGQLCSEDGPCRFAREQE